MTFKPSTGLAGWLFNKLRSGSSHSPELRVLDRVPLAPRQSLVLVETCGRRLLVATSAESAPAFFPLEASGQVQHDGNPKVSARRARMLPRRPSW